MIYLIGCPFARSDGLAIEASATGSTGAPPQPLEKPDMQPARCHPMRAYEHPAESIRIHVDRKGTNTLRCRFELSAKFGEVYGSNWTRLGVYKHHNVERARAPWTRTNESAIAQKGSCNQQAIKRSHRSQRLSKEHKAMTG